jgi:hypothetical protein
MPDLRIVVTPSQQWSRSHLVELIKVDDALKREFYMTMSNFSGSVSDRRKSGEGEV